MTLYPVYTDIVVFIFVVAETQIIKSMHRGMNVPSILDTFNRDARIYFTVIATAHFLIVLMYGTVRV